MISPEAHRLFRDLCDGAERFVLTTHMNPDGDALGSQLGLVRFLLARGKQVRIVNQDPIPEILRFLEADGLVVETYDPATHDAVLRSFDLIVLVDNSAPDRLGRMEPIMGEVAGHTLCIDHHPSRDTPWSHLILDEQSCATAVLIYDLVRDAGWNLDREAALGLYVGLTTDTGFFRFSSTDAKAYAIAAEFVRLGVEPSKVYQAIYERNSVAYTRLLGHALSDVHVEAGAVASAVVTRELVDKLNAEHVDTSEITTALLAMDGITVALLFRELEGGRVKVSLRSKGVLDLHRLAAEFGGGGHRNASGIVMEGTLDDVVRAVTGRVTESLAT
jgi:phosphoesterase RecJ-like protein